MPNVDRCCQINEINPNHAMRFLQKSLLAFYLLYLRGHCRMSIQAINFYYSSSCLADHGRVKSLSECLLSYVAILNECYKNELYLSQCSWPPSICTCWETTLSFYEYSSKSIKCWHSFESLKPFVHSPFQLLMSLSKDVKNVVYIWF
jgi:hypothetical protein